MLDGPLQYMSGTKGAGFVRRTFSLFSFSLGIRSAINTRLEDFVLALELVLEFILKLAHLLVIVDIHGFWAIALFEWRVARPGVGSSFRHVALVWRTVSVERRNQVRKLGAFVTK